MAVMQQPQTASRMMCRTRAYAAVQCAVAAQHVALAQEAHACTMVPHSVDVLQGKFMPVTQGRHWHLPAVDTLALRRPLARSVGACCLSHECKPTRTEMLISTA